MRCCSVVEAAKTYNEFFLVKSGQTDYGWLDEDSTRSQLETSTGWSAKMVRSHWRCRTAQLGSAEWFLDAWLWSEKKWGIFQPIPSIDFFSKETDCHWKVTTDESMGSMRSPARKLHCRCARREPICTTRGRMQRGETSVFLILIGAVTIGPASLGTYWSMPSWHK